ncbi:unnamed protein product [Cunninghamella blakesleeana]
MTVSVEDYEKILQILKQKLEESQNDNLTLRSELDDSKVQYTELSKDNDYLRNKIAGIQQDNSTYNNTQARLETQLYAQEQDAADLRKQVQQLLKYKKDTESKLQNELSRFETDRVTWQQREADLYNQIRTLSINGEPRTPRTPRRRSVTSTTLSPFGFPTPLSHIGEEDRKQNINGHHSDDDKLVLNGHDTKNDNHHNNNNNHDNDSNHLSVKSTTPKLASIDSSLARESKIAQRTIKAQDKLILDLKNELEQHKSIIQEKDTHQQRQSLKMHQLENEIANVKQVNQSLMEDNESYQILLHEKTISGEFMMNPIMQVENNESNGSALNLAAELNLANDIETTQKADEVDKTIQKLNEEVKTLQDTNRALQLYMNKILMKIIDNKQLEDVLSIDQPKPKPKPDPVTPAVEASQNNQQNNNNVGPTPTRTLSSTLLGKASNTRQQRRKTISYWGSKPPPVINNTITDNNNNNLDTKENTNRSTQRHSSVITPSVSTSTQINGTNSPHSNRDSNGGWAKALRRMSMGWSSSPATNPNPTATSPPLPTIHQPLHDGTPKQLHSSTSTSSNEELDTSRMTTRQPSMSRSGSSTTSLRVSSELAPLQEE